MFNPILSFKHIYRFHIDPVKALSFPNACLFLYTANDKFYLKKGLLTNTYSYIAYKFKV